MGADLQLNITAVVANSTGPGCSKACIAVRAISIPVATAGLMLSCLWLTLLVSKYRRNPKVFDVGLILMQLAYANFCLASLSYISFNLALLVSGQTREAGLVSRTSFAAVFCWFLVSVSVKNMWIAGTSVFRFLAIAKPMEFRNWLTRRFQLCSFALLTLTAVAIVSGAFAAWRLAANGSEQFLVSVLLPLTRTAQTYLPVPLILLISVLTVIQLAIARANRPGESSATSGRPANTNASPANTATAAASAAVTASENAFHASVVSSEADDYLFTAANAAAAEAIAAARAAAAGNQYAASAASAARLHAQHGTSACASAAETADSAAAAASAAAATYATAAKLFAANSTFATAATAASAAANAATTSATAANAFADEAAAAATSAIAANSFAAEAADTAAASAAAAAAAAANAFAVKSTIAAAAAAAAVAAADSNDINADAVAIAADVYAYAAEDSAVDVANIEAADAAAAASSAAARVAAAAADTATGAADEARNSNAVDSAATAAAAARAAAAASAATVAAAVNSNAVASAAATTEARSWCNTMLIVLLSAAAIAVLELPGAILVLHRRFRSFPDWLVPIDDLLVTFQSVVNFIVFYAFSTSFRAQLHHLLRRSGRSNVGFGGSGGRARKQQKMQPLVGTRSDRSG